MRYMIVFLFPFLITCANRSSPSQDFAGYQKYESYQPNPDDVVAELKLNDSTSQDGIYYLEVEVLRQLKTGFASKAAFSGGEKLELLSSQVVPSQVFIGVFRLEDSSTGQSFRLIRILK